MEQHSSVPRAQSKSIETKETTEGHAEKKTMAFDLKAYMASKVKAVNEALDSAVLVHYPEKIHEAMRYALFGGGKRLCSLVSIAACELFGGKQETVMPIAIAMEMIHDASQVHDDLPCMDDSNLRRGRPTTHIVYGEATAVLTGDALLCKAFEHIATETKGVSSENVLRVIARLGRSVGSKGMVAGQVVDLLSSADQSVTLETLEFIHLHKTAILVECSTVCGAIVGGASVEDIERLAKFGRTLGLLFQVVDDLLDVTKTTEELGKPAGFDALTDKATYPKLLGLEKTKVFAEELLRKARMQISVFDQVKAAPLMAIVDFVLNRPR
ncbi:unnamed protein product [Calypogeia fissa]